LLPSLNRAREQANRIKCASNLRQLAMAGLIYASENRGKFPRTYHDPGGLTNNLKGGASFAPTDNAYSLTSPSTPVDNNNVPASFYHLLKSSDLTAEVFNCPSTDARRAYAGGGSNASIQDYSNWPGPVTEFLSYSYNAPFPSMGAMNRGWKFDSSMNSDFPFAGDMNPGIAGQMSNGGGTSDVRVPGYTDSKKVMARGNSNNHKNEGQQVVYVDAHVEWQATPFAGAMKPNRPWRDNIYTNQNNMDLDEMTGANGRPTGQSADATDAVLNPTDEAKTQ
jgi:hypothetical protein